MSAGYIRICLTVESTRGGFPGGVTGKQSVRGIEPPHVHAADRRVRPAACRLGKLDEMKGYIAGGEDGLIFDDRWVVSTI
jgi:hypothetical protein